MMPSIPESELCGIFMTRRNRSVNIYNHRYNNTTTVVSISNRLNVSGNIAWDMHRRLTRWVPSVLDKGYPAMSVNSTSKFKVLPANGWLASSVTVSSSIPVIQTTKNEPSFCLT